MVKLAVYFYVCLFEAIRDVAVQSKSMSLVGETPPPTKALAVKVKVVCRYVLRYR